VNAARTARAGAVAVALLTGLTVTACAEPDPAQELCAQLTDLAQAVADVQALDPTTVTADELSQAAADAGSRLDGFQAVSEGRYDTAASTLRSTLDAVVQSVAASTGVPPEQVAAQLEDELTDVGQAWAALEDSVAPSCETGGG
jgi:hypothetical protein